ncbi:MAG: hypothetical protein ACOCMZ_02220, partial [Acetivibrio ethanolgignens]
ASGSFTILDNPDSSDYPEGAMVGYEVEISPKTDFKEVEKYTAEGNNCLIKVAKKQFGADGGRLYTRVRSVATLESSEVEYGEWSKTKELVFVKISKTNFPGMYTTLKKGDGEYYTFSDADMEKLKNGEPTSGDMVKKKYLYDQNKDGWLDQGEINDIRTLMTKDTKISSLKGVEYLTNLESINLAQYSGTKLDLSKNKIRNVQVRGILSKEITVIAPEAEKIFVEADMKQQKLSKIDVSACASVVDLNIGNWKSVVKTVRLPKEKKKLVSLSIRGFSGSTLDVNAYTKLKELDVLMCNISKVKLEKCKELRYLYFYRCNNIKSMDLSKNTKLKYLDFYDCRSISLKAVKRPKATKATTGKGCYWWETKDYQTDMRSR